MTASPFVELLFFLTSVFLLACKSCLVWSSTLVVHHFTRTQPPTDQSRFSLVHMKPLSCFHFSLLMGMTFSLCTNEQTRTRNLTRCFSISAGSFNTAAISGFFSLHYATTATPPTTSLFSSCLLHASTSHPSHIFRSSNHANPASNTHICYPIHKSSSAVSLYLVPFSLLCPTYALLCSNAWFSLFTCAPVYCCLYSHPYFIPSTVSSSLSSLSSWLSFFSSAFSSFFSSLTTPYHHPIFFTLSSTVTYTDPIYNFFHWFSFFAAE